MTPQRIQRKRTKGWRMPEGASFVGRPTRWGNPFEVGSGVGIRGFAPGAIPFDFHPVLTPVMAVELYRYALTHDTGTGLSEWCRIHWQDLRGRDLACWCALDSACHADVLLEIVNSDD